MGVLAILFHLSVASLPQQGFLAMHPPVTQGMVILVGFPAMFKTIYR